MNDVDDSRDHPLLGAWEFLTSMAAIIAVATTAIVISRQLEDARDVLATTSIVVLGIVVVLLASTLARLLKEPRAGGTGSPRSTP